MFDSTRALLCVVGAETRVWLTGNPWMSVDVGLDGGLSQCSPESVFNTSAGGDVIA